MISCLKLTQGLSWLTSIDSKLMNRFMKTMENDRGAQTQMMARMKARTKEIADLSVNVALYSLNRLSHSLRVYTK